MDVIPTDLIEATRTGDDLARYEAARSLASFGQQAVPHLIACLGIDCDLVRQEALTALRNLGPASSPAIQALIAVVTDGSDRERIDAADALAEIGPAAVEAVPILMACLKGDADNEDGRLFRLRAAHALWRITGQSQEVTAVAVELLDNEEFWLRSAAAELLGDVGGRDALPALRKALAEEIHKPAPDNGWRESVRESVRQAIKRIEYA